LPDRPAALRRGAVAWPLLAADVLVEESVAVIVTVPLSVS
jgi:hypothetical protein